METTKLAVEAIEDAIRRKCAADGIGAIEFFVDVLADESRKIADHLRTNWQDYQLAKHYEQFADELEKTLDVLR